MKEDNTQSFRKGYWHILADDEDEKIYWLIEDKIMDTIEALYILKHSPNKIAEKMKSFIYAFNGRRS